MDDSLQIEVKLVDIPIASKRLLSGVGPHMALESGLLAKR